MIVYQVCGIWEINVFVVSGFVTGGMMIVVWLAKEDVNTLIAADTIQEIIDSVHSQFTQPQCP